MSNLLNLDAVSPPQRHVAIGGNEYAVKTTSLGDYIQMLRDAEALEGQIDSGTIKQSDLIEAHIKSVAHAIPDMPNDVLFSLTGDQLQAIVSFIRETSGDSEGVTGEAAEEGKEQSPE